MTKIDIRHFRDGDAGDISTIICRNLREVNARDYPPDVIEDLATQFSPEKIIVLSRQREMFVAEVDGRLAGTAALARDDRTSEERYVCLTVFVLPEHHGSGIGSRPMDRVETLAQKKGAGVLHVPASITALPFYRKRGYVEVTTAQPNANESWVWMTKSLAGATRSNKPPGQAARSTAPAVAPPAGQEAHQP
jgi:GNAT superfamily N-acetyltransferase